MKIYINSASRQEIHYPILGLLVLCFLTAGLGQAQCDQDNKNWFKNGEWLHSATISPHKSINQEELARQYCLNPAWWDKAFDFIARHDLDSLPSGKYVIDENNVTAFVSEAPTKELGEINWETHQNFNDLQYVIKGKAKMGVASIDQPGTKVTIPYDPKKDVANYGVENAKFYVAKPGSFFIFSPREIHRPAVRMEGYMTIKKLLIKVRVPME